MYLQGAIYLTARICANRLVIAATAFAAGVVAAHAIPQIQKMGVKSAELLAWAAGGAP